MPNARAVTRLAVAAAALAMAAFLVRRCAAPDVWLAPPVFSPDHQYVAVHSAAMGGGFGNTYCFDYVDVMRAGPGDPAPDAGQRVYGGSCHALGPGSGTAGPPANAPLLRWSGPRTLEITFDPQRAAAEVTHLTFARQSSDGAVTISARAPSRAIAAPAPPALRRASADGG